MSAQPSAGIHLFSAEWKETEAFCISQEAAAKPWSKKESPLTSFRSWESELGKARSTSPCLQMRKWAQGAMLPAWGQLNSSHLHLQGWDWQPFPPRVTAGQTQLVQILCIHFVLFQEFETWQETKVPGIKVKQKEIHIHYVELMSTLLFCVVNTSLVYRKLAGPNSWIQAQLKTKSSGFLKIQKNKLNSASGKPHSVLHMQLGFPVKSKIR